MVEAARPGLTMLNLLAGSWISQALSIAAKLGIADLLQDGPRSCSSLAQATQTHGDSLYRVMRALASVGVFAEDEDGQFRLTPLAGQLHTNAPGSLRAFAIMLGEHEHWRAWEGMLHSVQTGRPAFDHIFGQSHFSYFEQHPEATRIFDAAMTSRSGIENKAIVAAYDFSQAATVVEVGGGEGSLLQAVLDASPHTQGVLFDQPHVIAAARSGWKDDRQLRRCEFMAGDFFAAVPAGGDLYIVKKVIHDWDDERAQQILINCRKSMFDNGRLLLIEPVIPAANQPSFNKLLDLLMLVWTSGGLERTEAEHRVLLASAGLDLRRVIPTRSGVSLLEAVPV
jgi:hypothetical protein